MPNGAIGNEPKQPRSNCRCNGYCGFLVVGVDPFLQKRYIWTTTRRFFVRKQVSAFPWYLLGWKKNHRYQPSSSGTRWQKLVQKPFLWNPERPATSLLWVTSLLLLVVVISPLWWWWFLVSWPPSSSLWLLGYKMMTFAMFPFVLWIGGSLLIVPAIVALVFASMTFVSLMTIPGIVVLVSLVFLSTRMRNPKPTSSVKREEKDASIESWWYRRSQEQLQQFDRRLAQKTRKPLALWSVEDVVAELIASGMEEYVATVREHRIDGSVWMQLTEENWRDDLGVYKLGDRKRLMALFRRLGGE